MPLCLDEKRHKRLVSVAPCRPLQSVRTAEPQTPPPSIVGRSKYLKSVHFFLVSDSQSGHCQGFHQHSFWRFSWTNYVAHSILQDQGNRQCFINDLHLAVSLLYSLCELPKQCFLNWRQPFQEPDLGDLGSRDTSLAIGQYQTACKGRCSLAGRVAWQTICEYMRHGIFGLCTKQ